ncbi:MAG: hypothetical protein HQL75_05485 [Magnetococcales bacterium]|nr:hypothetical protein [Magnetococcales bacterium]
MEVRYSRGEGEIKRMFGRMDETAGESVIMDITQRLQQKVIGLSPSLAQ